jgi:hypothetical protein
VRLLARAVLVDDLGGDREDARAVVERDEDLGLVEPRVGDDLRTPRRCTLGVRRVCTSSAITVSLPGGGTNVISVRSSRMTARASGKSPATTRALPENLSVSGRGGLAHEPAPDATASAAASTTR